MFVERVLSLTDSSDLKKVSLNTEVTDFARVEGWICTVVRRNVVDKIIEYWSRNCCGVRQACRSSSNPFKVGKIE